MNSIWSLPDAAESPLGMARFVLSPSLRLLPCACRGRPPAVRPTLIVLFMPLRAGPAHVVQFGPIGWNRAFLSVRHRRWRTAEATAEVALEPWQLDCILSMSVLTSAGESPDVRRGGPSRSSAPRLPGCRSRLAPAR
jgi:hypothetical protein